MVGFDKRLRDADSTEHSLGVEQFAKYQLSHLLCTQSPMDDNTWMNVCL